LAARGMDRVKRNPMVTVALFLRLEAKPEENAVAKFLETGLALGQSRSDHAYMVRAALGAGDLWRVRRVHG